MATSLHLTTIAGVFGRKRVVSSGAALRDTLPVEPISVFDEYEFTDGTGAGQAEEFWVKRGALTSGNSYSVTYDIRDGTLANFEGTAIQFDKIRGIYLKNRTVTAGFAMALSGDFGQFFGAGSHSLSLGPDGVLQATNPVDGWQASDVYDALTISSASKTIAFTIALWGTVV